MMNPVRPWSLRKAGPALALFLAAWTVYNLNCRPITSGDTAPAALLPFAVVLDGTLTFDRYAAGLSILYDGHAFFLRERNGHSYSRYPGNTWPASEWPCSRDARSSGSCRSDCSNRSD